MHIGGFLFSHGMRLLPLAVLLLLAVPIRVQAGMPPAIPDTVQNLAHRAAVDSSVGAAGTELRCISPADFTYAGDRRWTIDGSLPYRETSIRPIPALIVGGVFAAGVIGLHKHQANAWWAGERGEFHFQDDWDYALQADKAGHFTAGYTLAYFSGEALLSTGFSVEAATIWGATIGLAYHTVVEIEDGYGTRWGFSISDVAFNALGSGYYVLQYYLPALQHVTPKWQWMPVEWMDERPVPHETAVVDDYNASTFWLSFDVYNILPENLRDSWLPWLNIAVGFGARDIGYPGEENRRLIIALDYDMVRLLPEGGSFWNWIRQSMNRIKFPAPAVEFGPKTRFYLLYPLRF